MTLFGVIGIIVAVVVGVGIGLKVNHSIFQLVNKEKEFKEVESDE